MRLRVVTFLPSDRLAIYGLYYATARGGWFLAAAALVVAFMIVVRIHEQILRRRGTSSAPRDQRDTTRASRSSLGFLPDASVEVPPQYEPVANDLDLFGHASLYQLISQAHTPFGRDTLRDWLLEPAPVAEIADRQQAVAIPRATG